MVTSTSLRSLKVVAPTYPLAAYFLLPGSQEGISATSAYHRPLKESLDALLKGLDVLLRLVYMHTVAR